MGTNSDYKLPEKPDFSIFKEVSYQDWANRIEKELKGAHNPESLTALTAEGISISPLYNSEHQLPDYIPTLHNWLGDVKKDNKVKYLEPINLSMGFWNEQLGQAMHNGADGVWLKTSGADEWLPKFYHTFDATKNPIVWADSNDNDHYYEQILKAYASSAAIKGAVNRNTGTGKIAHPGLLDRIVSSTDIASKCQAPVLELTTLFWRASLVTSGHPELLGRILWQMGTSPLILQEIAKIRAFYLLAVQHMEDAGLEPFLPVLHTVGIMAAQSPEDPYSQLLRTSLAGISAMIGGSSYLTLLPADAANTDHYRWARNVVNMLRHESHIENFTDAAAGSYALDNLTSQIAEKAWHHLQELRMQAQIKGLDFANQLLRDKIDEAAKDYSENVAAGRIQVIGLNKFHNPSPVQTTVF